MKLKLGDVIMCTCEMCKDQRPIPLYEITRLPTGNVVGDGFLYTGTMLYDDFKQTWQFTDRQIRVVSQEEIILLRMKGLL